jgi:protein involved in ribonucleotide reduction
MIETQTPAEYEHIVYFSNLTNNTHRFTEKLQKHLRLHGQEIRTHRIPIKTTDQQPQINHNYILICPAYGTQRNNHVPPQVKKFLTNPDNRAYCTGIIGAGNLNFGIEYAAAGHVLANKLLQPLLHTFELAGFDTDIQKVSEILTERATALQIIS